MNDTFYTYGNKELITQKSFSVIPAESEAGSPASGILPGREHVRRKGVA